MSSPSRKDKSNLSISMKSTRSNVLKKITQQVLALASPEIQRKNFLDVRQYQNFNFEKLKKPESTPRNTYNSETDKKVRKIRKLHQDENSKHKQDQMLKKLSTLGKEKISTKVPKTYLTYEQGMWEILQHSGLSGC